MDMHKCETCGKEFKSSHAMKIHAARAHGEKKAKPGQARWMPPASALASGMSPESLTSSTPPPAPLTPERAEQLKAIERFGKALQAMADRAAEKAAKKAAKAAAAKAAARAAEAGRRRYMEFRVTLDHIAPPIWRRFLLAADGTFDDLHRAIQDSMRWDYDHLFEFRDRKGRRPIAVSDYENSSGLFGGSDEDAPAVDDVALADHFTRKGDLCKYVYDFGDNWEHRVELLGIVELPERFERRLLDGTRACPPEDSGGPWRYEICCRAAAMTEEEIEKLAANNTDNADDAEVADELASLKEWLGDWHPEAFDLAAVKKKFDKYRPGKQPGR